MGRGGVVYMYMREGYLISEVPCSCEREKIMVKTVYMNNF